MMGKAVKTKKLTIEEIFSVAKNPEILERLLLEHGYVSKKGLRKADKLVKDRIRLLERLK